LNNTRARPHTTFSSPRHAYRSRLRRTAGRAKLVHVIAIAGNEAMITEIAQIDVKPGMEAEFEAGVKNAAPIFQRAKGCHGMELRRSIEKPSRYRLFIEWDTVDDHNVGFRGSPDFQEWRKLVGHCFAAPPDVEHVQQVVRGF
jgi:heme-degrading monooxygenase HmoA